MPRDFYEVLGVGRDAEAGEVKSAFRRLARELHPDVNAHDPDAEHKFKEAAEAYEVLSDPERRQAYDAYGHEGLRGAGAGFPGGGAGFASVEDLFNALFTGQGIRFGPRGPMKGQDLVQQVEITAIDAMLGANVMVQSQEGEREIELPSGTQHGTQYVLREHGLPGTNGGPPGDMVIVVNVLVPSELSEEQAELARKLGESLEDRNLRGSRSGGDESFFSRVRRAFG
jgi:DnaJ-class molecular chaperone